jgi:hypothetical protein
MLSGVDDKCLETEEIRDAAVLEDDIAVALAVLVAIKVPSACIDNQRKLPPD